MTPFIRSSGLRASSHLVMNFVVIPLSAASRGTLSWPVVVNGLLIHMFGVGIPAVLWARKPAGRPRASVLH
jgi:hypothetical protein